MKNKTIAILGGSGFIGSYIVKELISTGAYIKILSRHTEKAAHLKTLGDIGQVFIQNININDQLSIEKSLIGSDIIINLIGSLHETEKKLKYLHITFPKIIATFAKKHKVEKVIHFSALGVRKAYDSIYACSKYEGEKSILSIISNVTIVRPSIVFGEEDQFINLLKRIIEISPIMPLFYKGKTKFQPVYVKDVALAVKKIVLENSNKYHRKIFEIAGDKIFSFRKIIEIIEKKLHKNIIKINIPHFFAIIFAILCRFLPNPIITIDQLILLKYNNILDKKSAWNLYKLKIKPQSFEKMLKEQE